MSKNYQLEQEKKERVLILRVGGRLDSEVSPDIEKEVLDLIQNGEKNLILNMKSVLYLSSAGMRFILSVAKAIKNVSGKLIVSDLSDMVLDVIKMAGFDHVIVIKNSEKEAVDEF